MIKEKITSEIKNRFKQEIRKTIETRKEYGFFICKDDKGGLFPSDITCIGDECKIKFEDPVAACPGKKIQGTFHSHPLLFSGRKEIAKLGSASEMAEFIDVDIKEVMERGLAKYIDPKIYSIESPSSRDLLRAILSRHLNKTDGTICTGIDFCENIECWTAKQVSKETFMKVTDAFEADLKKKGSDIPKKWIIDLFDREIINLK